MTPLSRRAFGAIAVCMSSGSAIAQNLEYDITEVVYARSGEEVRVLINISFDPPWYIYSDNERNADSGSTPTSVEFEAVPHIQLADAAYPPGVDVGTAEIYLAPTVEIAQPIRVRPRAKAGCYKVEGVLTYQLCKIDLCLPPEDVDVNFEVLVEEG